MIIIEERCLQKYFEAEIVLANHITAAEDKALFNALADVFGIEGARREELFALAKDDALRQIDSDSIYKQHKRLQQYSEEFGFESVLSENALELLDTKGKAIFATTEAGIVPSDQQTASDIANNVAKVARTGNVTAMFLAAVMFFEGLIVKRDEALAKFLLRKLALWSSPDAQLLGVKYDRENATKYVARLIALTSGLPEAELVDCVRDKFPTLPQADEGMMMLRKAVERKLVKADCYDANFSRIAHSDILLAGDKQRMLFSGDPRAIGAVSSLPLKLQKKPMKMSFSEIKTRFARVDEQKMVARALSYNAARKTVCFESDDVMLLKEYAAAIEGCIHSGNVRRLEFEKLDESELLNNVGNIFLRTINEDENNVFLISVAEDSSPQNIEIALSFLDSAKREHFKIKELGIELDLSSVCVVMFVDSALRSVFQGHVAFVPLAKVTVEEKLTILDGELAKLVASGEFPDGLSLDAATKEKLVAMQLENSTIVLEQAARHAFIDGTSVITLDHVERSLDELGPIQGSFGFGNRG